MESLEGKLVGMFRQGWWMILLRGIAAIAFAVLTWTNPGISLAALVLLFGAYALVDGVFAIVMAFAGRRFAGNWWVTLLVGLVGVAVGMLTFLSPGITALALLYYIAFWAILTGVLEIMVAIRLRKEISSEWILALAGVASVAFGVLLTARPGAGALALLSIIAAYAFLFGILLVALAIRARSFAHRLGSVVGAPRTA